MISPPIAIDQNGPIINYEVRISTPYFDILDYVTNVTPNSTEYPLESNLNFVATGLEEFVKYSLRVRAYTSVGPGIFSDALLQWTTAAGILDRCI